MSKYNFRAEAREMSIDGEIDAYWGENLRAIRNDLKASKDITLYINSGGGSVTEGFAIADALRLHGQKHTVKTVGCGLVASIATMVFLGGTKGQRVMTENSMFMIHDPLVGNLSGRSKELRETADTLDTMKERILVNYVEAIASNNKLINDSIEETRAQVNKWMDSERFFTAQEALEVGLIDGIIEAKEFITPENVAEFENRLRNYKNVPAALLNRIEIVKAMKQDNNPTEGENKSFLRKIYDALGELFAGKPAPENKCNEEKDVEETTAEDDITNQIENTENESEMDVKNMSKEELLKMAEALSKMAEEMPSEEVVEETETEEEKEVEVEMEAEDAMMAEMKAMKEELARLKAQATQPKVKTTQPKTENKSAFDKSLEEVSNQFGNQFKALADKIVKS